MTKGNLHEKTISYYEYIEQARTELQTISTWPNPVEKERWEGDGVCPFDFTPGAIRYFLELEDYPSWARTFLEKGVTPDEEHFSRIPINIEDYPDMEFVCNGESDEVKIQYPGSYSVKHFLNDEPGSSLCVERELLELLPGYPPIFIERIIATLTENYGTQEAQVEEYIVSLCIIRPLVEGEWDYEQSAINVWHVVGVEPYDVDEIGINQLWYQEKAFMERVDKELLFAPKPISFGFGRNGTFAVDTKSTYRNPVRIEK